jgi:type VI secretion system protein ImpG
MSDPLLPYLARELRNLRESGAALAARHPHLAGRLDPGAQGGGDPDVERLLQGVALIAARLHRRLDETSGDLARALLDQVFPQLSRPVPARAIVRLEPSRSAGGGGEPRMVAVPAGTPLLARPLREAGETNLRGLACRFRTVYPAEFAPITVEEAELRAIEPGSPLNLSPPGAGADARLRLRLRCPGNEGFAALGLTRLRLHLQGNAAAALALHELVMGRASVAAALRRTGPPGQADWRSGARPVQLAPVGFEPEEALLPGVPDSLHGYRLLLEYFTFPEKFLFLDVVGLDAALPGLGGDIELAVELRCGERRRSLDLLARDVGPGLFHPNCVPVVNLFACDAEPIRLTHEAAAHPLVVDRRRPDGFEVHAVEGVAYVGRGGRLDRREMAPLHARHRLGLGLPGLAPPADAQELYYAVSRQVAEDGAQDLQLAVLDRTLSPATPTDGVLLPRVLATNRDVPRLLAAGPDGADFTLEGVAALTARRLGPMMPPVRLPHGAQETWQLVSHLAAGRRSLVDRGADGLREILAVYNLFDGGGDAALALEVHRRIESIVGLQARSVAMLVDDRQHPLRRAIVNGTEVEITFDEAALMPGAAFLFSAVLDRFLAGSAAANTFTRLLAASRQRNERIMEWLPRIGLRPLL